MNNKENRLPGGNSWKKLAVLELALLLTLCCAAGGAFYLRRRAAQAQKNSAQKEWTVTQYAGSGDGLQSMFYSITDTAGHLVVIDGGWEQDEPSVRQLLQAYGNHVDAWIITHAHPDHVGALNAILADNENGTDQKVDIDTIYTVEVNRERYEATAKDYDVVSSYEDFISHTEKLSNVVYLKDKDTLDLIGLHMKVLNSWNEKVDAMENNLLNNGSLMFRISGEQNSMLFCADVQSQMENDILAEHQGEISSDYVQLGHHGNWGLTMNFYNQVNPKAVFFDAPSPVIDNEQGTYDGYQLRNDLAARGCTIFRWGSAPNAVVLR